MDLRVNGEVFGKFDVKSADEKNPDLFSVKFRAQAGQKGLGVSFLNDFYDPNNPDPNRRDRNVYVLGIQVDGPLKSSANPGAASQKIFAALAKGATTEDAVRAALQSFANRAFRRSAGLPSVLLFTPWSGLSMHPIEHVIYFSTILLFFFIPSHPIHMINLASRLGVAPAQGHTGFDRLAMGDDATMDVSYYAHYLHHKYFEVNYSDGMVPLDKWFGSFHDGTPEAHEAMKARRLRRTA